MINVLLNRINEYRTSRVYRHSRYRDQLADLPAGLFAHWQRRAIIEFKGIPRDAFFYVRAAEGLMMFFDCVAKSGRPSGLPSKAADSVWHAWEALESQHLEQFCIRHFGRSIPHTEGAEMDLPMDLALANTLVASRALDGLSAGSISVPRLFLLDRKLKMPDGHWYTLASGEVAWRRMGYQGQPVGEFHYPGMFGAAQLLAAGLISQLAYDDSVRQAQRNGGSCGSGCGSSASGCDAGGGSCGGGCGGGD